MPAAVSLIGKPDCGKTTLLEKLIPELTARGLKVGTIKHHVHAFEMDTPAKDSWRHKQAGASVVALSSPTGLGIIRDTDSDLAVEYLVDQYFRDVDLVITEGYKRSSLPKIEVFRKEAHAAPLGCVDETLIATVSDVSLYEGIPRYGLDDISGLAGFLVDSLVSPAGERNFPEDTIGLTVNGSAVRLDPAVKKMLNRNIRGLVPTLKDCHCPWDIELTITSPDSSPRTTSND